MVGRGLEGGVMVVDDVMRGGRGIGEWMEIIEGNGGRVGGVLIWVDGEEGGGGEIWGIEEVEGD